VDGPPLVQGAIDATLGMVGQQIWALSRQLSTLRASAPLANALRPILCAAREVLIVDAYFNPSVALAQSKWLKPLEALAAQVPADGRLTRFEVHALSSRHDPWPAGLFVQHCRNNVPSALPKGVTLNAMLWKERSGGLQFHKRVIVTDIGGVDIDPGFDEGPPGETYDLQLLSKEAILGYLAKFAPAAAPYDLVEHQCVMGA
jgi:hypothetical protein